MESSTILDYLVSDGAHEDEIRVLTHPANEVYRGALEVLVTGSPPTGNNLTNKIIKESIHGLLKLFPNHALGLGLALERIVPRALSMFPGCIRPETIVNFIESDRIEHVANAMNLHGWYILYVCLGHQSVSADFILAEVSNSVESIDHSHLADPQLSINVTLGARSLSKYDRMDYLRAVFRGAERCTDPNRILNVLAKQVKSRDPCLSNFLSCPFVFGVDPFALSGIEPREYISRIEDYVTGVLRSSPLAGVVMDYFCKFRDQQHSRRCETS